MSNIREEFVAALRETADFLESHPDAPLPDAYGGITLRAQVKTVAELRAAFHLSGPWEKEHTGDIANYRKTFGQQPDNRWGRGSHITYTVSLPREEVCVKRKTGTRYVPPMPSPSYTSGYYEDTYEWDCM
jgi:hypothetical protein